jgi:diaminopimelate epimerase
MIRFSKMHGLGNDFMVINGISQTVTPTLLPINQLANRNTGIGFDQLLLIGPANNADFACRIFNSDGSEAEQCGNGLRCVARFIVEEGLTQKKSFTIATSAGIFAITIQDNSLIQVAMGIPCFQPEKIPFITDSLKKTYTLKINHSATPLEFAVLSMGNPHAIMQVSAVENFPVKDIGAEVAAHPAFPHSTNVGFMEIVNRQQIRLRTFERGTGETFACGSNACAAVVAGINNGLLDTKVNVSLALGDLWVEWPSPTQPVLMTGPAVHVFDGVI